MAVHVNLVTANNISQEKDGKANTGLDFKTENHDEVLQKYDVDIYFEFSFQEK